MQTEIDNQGKQENRGRDWRGYKNAAEYWENRGVVFPPSEEINPDAVAISRDELLLIEVESKIEAFHQERLWQRQADALFNDDTPADGRIVYIRHALDSIKTTTDRVLTKRALQAMEPLSCQPGLSAELLDTVHTMLIDMYYYGRERLLTEAYDMGAGVKV